MDEYTEIQFPIGTVVTSDDYNYEDESTVTSFFRGKSQHPFDSKRNEYAGKGHIVLTQDEAFEVKKKLGGQFYTSTSFNAMLTHNTGLNSYSDSLIGVLITGLQHTKNNARTRKGRAVAIPGKKK